MLETTVSTHMQVSGEVTKSNIIATVASLLGGTVVVLAAGLAYGSLRTDEANSQSRIQALEIRLAAKESDVGVTEHRFTVIEGSLGDIKDTLKRIENSDTKK